MSIVRQQDLLVVLGLLFETPTNEHVGGNAGKDYAHTEANDGPERTIAFGQLLFHLLAALPHLVGELAAALDQLVRGFAATLSNGLSCLTTALSNNLCSFAPTFSNSLRGFVAAPGDLLSEIAALFSNV